MYRACSWCTNFLMYWLRRFTPIIVQSPTSKYKLQMQILAFVGVLISYPILPPLCLRLYRFWKKLFSRDWRMHPDLSRIIFRHYNFIKYLYYFYWVIMIRLIENISTASWLVWRTVLQVHEYNTVAPCCWRTYSDGSVPDEARMTPTWHLICCWRRRSSG